MSTYTITSRAKLEYVGDSGWSVDWFIPANGLIVNPDGNSVGKITRWATDTGPTPWRYSIQITVEPHRAIHAYGFATWQEAVLDAASQLTPDFGAEREDGTKA